MHDIAQKVPSKLVDSKIFSGNNELTTLALVRELVLKIACVLRGHQNCVGVSDYIRMSEDNKTYGLS